MTINKYNTLLLNILVQNLLLELPIVLLNLLLYLSRCLTTEKCLKKENALPILTVFPVFWFFFFFLFSFSRSWDLERQIKQLKTYRDLYQALCKWICDAKRRQDSIESMKLCDSNSIMRYLHDQKVCNT